MSRARVVARASWRCLWHPGTDAATLSATEDGWRLAGHAEIEFPDGPTAFRYWIACTPGWEPREAEIRIRTPSADRRIGFEVDEAGEWIVGGFPNRDLRGCVDLDLAATPATNTLALKRLALPVGEAREIRTAWVLFPDIEPLAVRQRYTRMSETHYRYEGLHNGFVGEFDVDDAGLVTDYPEAWERIPPARRGAGRSARGRRRGGT